MRNITYWMMAVAMAVSIAACQRGKGGTQERSQRDSDDYYMELSERGVKYYQAYAVDSFVQTYERIHQYLLRNEGRSDRAIDQLRAGWLKARGVYFSAIAGRPDSAVAYTDRALQLMERQKMDPELRVITMLNKAYFYRQAGQLDLSADSYLQTLATADSLQTSENSRIAIYLGISTVYTAMADYVNSKKWWKKCEELLPRMTKPDQFIYYNDRGNDYFLQERYREALPCFEKAAALVRDDEGKTWDYYTALANTAEILIHLNEANRARPLVAEADSFFRSVNFGILIYYIETSKIELAMLDGKTGEATRMIAQSPTPEDMIPAAKVMRLKAEEQVWRQAGNEQKAYRAHQELHALTDSIQTANVKMQMSARLMEYEHDKRLMEQQRQIEQGRMNARLAWALLLIALMAVVLLASLYIMRRRKGRMQALQLHQRLIASQLSNARNRLSPHFIYNALNHEMLSQMKGKAVNFDTLTQLLRRGLALADTLQASLEEELTFVGYYATIEGRQLGDDFRYEVEIADGINTSQVFLPAMTIQIFAENAIKHGLRTKRPQQGQQRRLTIRAERREGATLVEVIDNGAGLKDGPRQQEHTGMRVVRQTVQMLNEQNTSQIRFGVENTEWQGETGCRSWILLPDGYRYETH